MATTLLLGSQVLSSTFGSFSPSHVFSPFKGVFATEEHYLFIHNAIIPQFLDFSSTQSSFYPVNFCNPMYVSCSNSQLAAAPSNGATLLLTSYEPQVDLRSQRDGSSWINCTNSDFKIHIICLCSYLCIIRLSDFIFYYSSPATAYLKEFHPIMRLHLTGLRFSINGQK